MEIRQRIRNFFLELRRRRVIRVTGAYVVAAIAALEGLDAVLPATNAPEGTYTGMVVLAVFLLPVVVFLSWVFDITPEGVQRTAAPGVVSAGAAPHPIEATPYWAERAQPLKAEGPIDSLAVLPFSNDGGDSDTEYLSQGISESIINTMSRLSGVRVVPRATVFLYREDGAGPVAAGRELRARGVVTGRVSVRGEMIRVGAELIDAAREEQVWGDQYSGPMSELLDLQERVAKEISRSLELRLSRADREHLEARATRDAEAYQEYLRGRHQWNKRTEEGFDRAAAHFRAAIEKDPTYAVAYTGLSDIYNLLGYYNIRRPSDVYPLARDASGRALVIDDGLAEAHASRGYTTLFYDWDWPEARACFERAIALDPGYATAHQWFGWYHMAVRDFEAALACFEEAQRKDPLSLIINDHLAYGYILTGRYDDARRQIERAHHLDPVYPLAFLRQGTLALEEGHLEEAAEAYGRAAELSRDILGLGYQGMALARAGRDGEARQILERMRERSERRFVSPLEVALLHSGLGDLDAVFHELERAVEERVSDMIRLPCLPWSEAVRDDPRFEAARKRVRPAAG